MSCDEVRDLLGAYVLDAVSAGEREAIEAHLDGCGLHEEVASLRAAALGLGPSSPVREPPPKLEQRIMRAALAERPLRAGAPKPETVPRRRRRPRLVSAPALAAVLAVVAIGLGAWVTFLVSSDDAGEEQFVFSYRGRGGKSWLRLETVFGDSPSSVRLGGFERLPAERAYHLWAIRDERWLRVGFFNTNPEGGWAGDFDFSFEDGDEIAVTHGSTSGDTRPEGEPLFRTPI